MTSESAFEYPQTGFVLPAMGEFNVGQLVEFGVTAAAAGFESVWAEETWNYDPFGTLGQVSTRTEVPLGTCIANAYARSPGSLAMSVATLQEATGGRSILGLGASTPAVVEGFHGKAHGRPLRRLRELVEILDLALAGKQIDYEGEIFDLSGFRLTSGCGPPPVFNAALGERNIALTVEHMEGLIPHLFPIPAIRDRVDRVREDVGTDRTPHVAPSVPTSIAPDADRARSILADHVATYVGSVEFYNTVVAANGFSEEAQAIAAAWEEGDRDGAADCVSAELLDAVGITGTPERAQERLATLLDDHVDSVLVSFPKKATGEMVEQTIEALGPQS